MGKPVANLRMYRTQRQLWFTEGVRISQVLVS
jgi:hypothetical protein